MQAVSSIKIQNSWVFNFKYDFISFVLPFFVAFLFIGTKYDYVENYWFSYFLAKIFIGGGHIFATYIPLFATKAIITRFDKRLYIMPILFVALFAIANFISDIYFMNMLALVGLLHIYLQHFAWLKMSQSHLSAMRKKLERLFLMILIGFPNFIWIFRQLDNPPSYLYGITITYFAPNFNIFSQSILIAFSLFAVLGSLGLSVRKVDKNYIIDFGRLNFFLTTSIWMCFGLFFIKALGFFHVYLALSHGTSYMAYITQSWPKHLENGVWASNYRFLIVCAVSLLFGIIWLLSFKVLKNSPSYLIFLPWVPLIVHYAFDSTIWRKSKVIV